MKARKGALQVGVAKHRQSVGRIEGANKKPAGWIAVILARKGMHGFHIFSSSLSTFPALASSL